MLGLTDKQIDDLRQIHEIQGLDGTWNYDPYHHGLYNGIELTLAIIENREPVYKEAPEKWRNKELNDV